MDSIIEELLDDDDGLYGCLSEEYDFVAQAIDEAEEIDFGLMVDDDDEDDEILNAMGIDIICDDIYDEDEF